MMIPRRKRVKLTGRALVKLIERIYKRENHCCAICGKWVPWGIKPHHFPQGADKSDEYDHMVLLCYECHQKAHATDVKFMKERIKNYLEPFIGMK